MPSYSNTIETTTWHDQRPTHAKRSQEEIAALHAENMAWDAVDHLMNKLIDEQDQDEREILADAHARMTAAAVEAGESLREIKRRII